MVEISKKSILDPRDAAMIPTEKLISLREAAKISGYSPDYIGQLIRSGKLPGQQVFSNVAWMTTEEAILNYMAKNSKAGQRRRFWERFASPDSVARISLILGGVVIAILGVFILFLFYIFAVSVDHRIERNSLKTGAYEQQ